MSAAELSRLSPPIQQMEAAPPDNSDSSSAYDSLMRSVLRCLAPEGIEPPRIRSLEELEAERESVTVISFPCSGNCCCALVDLATLCHLCSGSIFCCKRPTIYDPCCPTLLPPYIMTGENHDTCCDEPTSCFFYPSEEFRARAAAARQAGSIFVTDGSEH